MYDELEKLKKNLNDSLTSLGFDKLIELDRPQVPLWKYLINHCKSYLFELFPFIIISYLAAHKLLLGYSHFQFFSFILSITFVFHLIYKMFSLASYISQSEYYHYAFKIALNQCTDAYINGAKECRERTKRMIEEFGFIPEEHENLATILPFKKPTDEPKLN